MRFKYYIRGFGLGVIFATVILMVGFALHGGMTNEQIKKEAQKLGMIEPNSQTETQKETQKESEKESQMESQTESQSESTSDTQNETQTESESVLETESESQTQSESQEEYVYIEVENGDTCRMVGQKLLEQKVIKDVEEFRAYFSSIHMANNFHVGVYKVPLNATYEELAKILVW